MISLANLTAPRLMGQTQKDRLTEVQELLCWPLKLRRAGRMVKNLLATLQLRPTASSTSS